ncbi:MAG: DUF1802 family protein, partial [Bryobacteraceae bacterium]
LKPEWSGHAAVPECRDRIRIELLGRIAEVLPAPESIGQMRAADQHHVWNDTYLRMRYEYRPDLPLYLILIRAYRLREPQWIPQRASYAGCKSWVNLTEEIDVSGAAEVLDDAAFAGMGAGLAGDLRAALPLQS